MITAKQPSTERREAHLSVEALLGRRDAVVNLLPADLPALTRQDAEYHLSQRDSWIEINQIETLRNTRFHNAVLDAMSEGLPAEAAILELGGGVGYDLQLFCRRGKPFRCYVFSEPSEALVACVRNSMPDSPRVVFCALDANQLLIADEQFDAVFMIAALHHLADWRQGVREIDRVSKSGARIVFGIEPNRIWCQCMVLLRRFLRPLFAKRSHSPSDEQAEGFVLKDFQRMSELTGWELRSIQPVWFLCGFLHQGLEFLFRVFRLSKRIRVPRTLEKLIIQLDRLFFCIPCADRLAWHYTVVFEKKARSGTSGSRG